MNTQKNKWCVFVIKYLDGDFIFLHGALYFYWKLAKFNKFYSKLICWFSDKKGTDLYLTLFDLIMPIVFYPCLECSSLLVEKEIESIISTYNLYVCMYACVCRPLWCVFILTDLRKLKDLWSWGDVIPMDAVIFERYSQVGRNLPWIYFI